MEIMEQQAPNRDISCSKCYKKQQLIEKYESLITLLKKKADRSQLSQLSQSNKFSMGDITTSHTSFNGGNIINKYILPMALNRIQEKKKSLGFYQIKSQSYIKKVTKSKQFLNKLSIVCSFKQKQCFNKLKQLSKDIRQQNILCSESLIDNHHLNQQQNGNTTELRQRQLSERGPNSPSNKKSIFSQPQNSITIDQWNYKSLACVHQDLVTSVNKSVSNTLKQESLPLLFSKKSTSSTQQVKNLYKNLFVLEQQNYAKQIKIKNLQRHMEEALARQIKQNRKKTESLEMVAEQMAQKNQLITELQEKITMLEQRYEYETNGVLEDELTQNRKQVEKLQKVNIKLDNELRKIRQKLAESQVSTQQLQKDKIQTTKKNSQLKEALFQMQQKILFFQAKQTKFQTTCQKIQKIFDKLKFHEKSFSKASKSNSKSQTFPSNQDKNSLEEFYRLELVFVFLYNIEDETYNFTQHEHLFDQEQLQVLKQLKNKFSDMKNKLENKVDLMQTIQCAQYRMQQANLQRFQGNTKNDRQDNNIQDVYCHQNMVDGSIFDVLNDHRQNNSRIQQIPKPSQRIQPQKNLTMKLLQLQIQKNKQIEKISELKQKSMYVRNIILNLMKSLEIKQSLLKTQTSGILDLIFDVFEYSEEQKQIMFTHAQQPKQRKFFGFI